MIRYYIGFYKGDEPAVVFAAESKALMLKVCEHLKSKGYTTHVLTASMVKDKKQALSRVERARIRRDPIRK